MNAQKSRKKKHVFLNIHFRAKKKLQVLRPQADFLFLGFDEALCHGTETFSSILVYPILVYVDCAWANCPWESIQIKQKCVCGRLSMTNPT